MFVKLPFFPLVEQTDVFPTGSTPSLEERVLLFITDQFTSFQIRLTDSGILLEMLALTVQFFP